MNTTPATPADETRPAAELTAGTWITHANLLVKLTEDAQRYVSYGDAEKISLTGRTAGGALWGGTADPDTEVELATDVAALDAALAEVATLNDDDRVWVLAQVADHGIYGALEGCRDCGAGPLEDCRDPYCASASFAYRCSAYLVDEQGLACRDDNGRPERCGHASVAQLTGPEGTRAMVCIAHLHEAREAATREAGLQLSLI